MVPTGSSPLVALCDVDEYMVQEGKVRLCGLRPIPLGLDTTAIDIIRVATGVTR